MAWKPEEAVDVEVVWDMAVVGSGEESKMVLRVKVGARRVSPAVGRCFTQHQCQASHEGDGDRRCTRMIDAQINAQTTYPLSLSRCLVSSVSYLHFPRSYVHLPEKM